MTKDITSPQSICRFGIARRDITPPVGIYHRMWGAATHDRSEGLHRPLLATAFAFQPEDNLDEGQYVVALDHCLLYQPAVQSIIKYISNQGICRPEQIVITFSHTHAAGLMDPKRADMPGGDLIAPYLEQLAKLSSEALAEAKRAAEPAILQFATGRCSLAAHRDYWDEKNKIHVCGFNPDVAADDTVMVARVSATSGKSLASIINYACHPTTLAWENRLISPDYIGAMREIVEQQTQAPCVFLQGASGELGPRQGFVGDTEVADKHGRQLGFAALSALESLLPPLKKLSYKGTIISGATIGEWRACPLNEVEKQAKRGWKATHFTVPLRYRADLMAAAETKSELERWTHEEKSARESGDSAKAADARAMAERMRRQLARLAELPAGDVFPFPVSMWQTGDAVWVAVEGEPYCLLQSELRQRFPGTPIFVMVLANGTRVSYLPTAATYGKGIYQETIALLEKGSLENLIDAIGNEIEKQLHM